MPVSVESRSGMTEKLTNMLSHSRISRRMRVVAAPLGARQMLDLEPVDALRHLQDEAVDIGEGAGIAR